MAIFFIVLIHTLFANKFTFKSTPVAGISPLAAAKYMISEATSLSTCRASSIPVRPKSRQ